MERELRLRLGLTALMLVLVIGLALASPRATGGVLADDGLPPGPDRFTVLNVEYTSYEWWLVQWTDNRVACQVHIDHEGLPTGNEVYLACGEILYDKWVATRPCSQSETASPSCQGYYLHFIHSATAQRDVGVALPPPVVWMSLEGCAWFSFTHRCGASAQVLLVAEEPLAGETITSLAGRIDGEAFTCAATCRIELVPTDEDGLELEFWAFSSYGDSSQVFTAQVRVAPADDPGPVPVWYVDVLSTQWRGAPLASCAQMWAALPPVGIPPVWLTTPAGAVELASNIPYEYLAANLIENGIADASQCQDGGLTPLGMATPCGLAAARPAVDEWQDRFDAIIYETSLQTGIPAQLLKNLFSRESQFWPGVLTDRPEAGLGQLTENGADTTLLWNPSFFEQFCPLVLDDRACRQGYPHMPLDEQELLRHALVRRVDAFCADCPLGLDLQRADASVHIFAETLLANCAQTGRIIYNAYGEAPGELSTYQDLWRFTLVNYNAGAGCLTLAVQETESSGEALDWEHLSANLTPVCQPAIDYVIDISRE